MRPNFTAERESQDAEYAEAVRADEARDETERQRDEAERALAGPVQVGVVRAARLRRLVAWACPCQCGEGVSLAPYPRRGRGCPVRAYERSGGTSGDFFRAN